MNKSFKNIIEQILSIIGYSDDKEKFAQRFFDVCQQKALVNLVLGLSKDKQELLDGQLAKAKDAREVSSILTQYFEEKEINEALKLAIEKNFSDYLIKIDPVLSKKQQGDLQSYLKNLTALA